jgi:hypothetical protein
MGLDETDIAAKETEEMPDGRYIIYYIFGDANPPPRQPVGGTDAGAGSGAETTGPSRAPGDRERDV